MRPLRPHSRANATANATGTPFTRKRIITIAAAATAVAIIITMFPLGGATKIGEAIERNRIERLNATITNIYTTAYQQDADATLITNRDKATATLDDPFTAVNPYGTNTTSMYVYFTTSEATSVSYTVHAEGYPDFTATANQGKDYATTHEFIVLGLIPKTTNTITLKLTDASGSTVATGQITCKGPKLLGDEEIQLE